MIYRPMTYIHLPILYAIWSEVLATEVIKESSLSTCKRAEQVPWSTLEA